MFLASIHCLTATEGEVDVVTSLRMCSHTHAKTNVWNRQCSRVHLGRHRVSRRAVI